jgi:hypothetical protein
MYISTRADVQDMSIFQRAKSKYQEDGFVSFCFAGATFLTNKLTERIPKVVRKLTPTKRNAVWNGVKVPSIVAPKRRLIDDYVSIVRTDYKKSEGGEVESHKEFTRTGDKVVIIGGGRGVTTVHALQESEPGGDVIVYEPSKKHSEIVQEVVELNGIESSYEIRNILVGPEIEVYDDSTSYETINPNELPQCDVLEMDCEGAELEIIKNMIISPRVIILEVHPQRYKHAPEAVDELIEMGYDIVSRRSNEGECLTDSRFDEILEECARGNAPAPIVVAVDNSMKPM